MKRSKTKPILWALFSMGGTVAALCLPVLVFIFGWALPWGMVELATISERWAQLGKLGQGFCCLMIIFMVWHALHRFFLTCKDLHWYNKVHGKGRVFYGLAILTTLFALWGGFQLLIR